MDISVVMGKSESRLRFKLRFEHFWRIDFNNEDSIQKSAILFEISAVQFV